MTTKLQSLVGSGVVVVVGSGVVVVVGSGLVVVVGSWVVVVGPTGCSVVVVQLGPERKTMSADHPVMKSVAES